MTVSSFDRVIYQTDRNAISRDSLQEIFLQYSGLFHQLFICSQPNIPVQILRRIHLLKTLAHAVGPMSGHISDLWRAMSGKTVPVRRSYLKEAQ
ncbi:hypothetical protein DFP92_11374 [Yoonia sediminilitoris]|uniref:Uncharacterized protein n=1 Tax=Yoonia sediminilitoris TaxID=1286148 RepID=A0A2T6K9R0_9RHOB|nr:hypothetical protein [Yoonia sediminilitoris]PUB11556.1 hypothetical protein C8N45_11374 [Yoonia sediminilitoris]RCW91756.1 hypothetical protein DFP92_11374 [Yoonia sediminilitoris]